MNLRGFIEYAVFAVYKEQIGDYLVTNLNLSYTIKKLAITDAVTISLQLHNFLDRKYVSVINSSDDNFEDTGFSHYSLCFLCVFAVIFQ